jgi:hypothetical protein
MYINLDGRELSLNDMNDTEFSQWVKNKIEMLVWNHMEYNITLL